MAWIESHQSLLHHWKTARLSRALGISKVTAIGHLHAFWWWCLDNAPDGRLTGMEPADIADGACWEGDPEEFIRALEYSEFLDREGDSLIVHDWFDYAGRLIAKRQANAVRMRQARAANVQRTCNARTGATVPYRTKEDDDDNAHAREIEPNEPSPPPTDPTPHTDHQAVRAYIQRHHPTWDGSPDVWRDLGDYADDLGWPMVLEALIRTDKEHPSSPWRYLRRVLQSWLEGGIRTKEQLEIADQQRTAQREAAATRERRRSPPVVEYRHVDEIIDPECAKAFTGGDTS